MMPYKKAAIVEEFLNSLRQAGYDRRVIAELRLLARMLYDVRPTRRDESQCGPRLCHTRVWG